MSSISISDQDVANRLSELIKEKRIKSIRAFALSINADPSYFSKVTKCERSIPETMVDAIHDKYGVSPDWLLWGKSPKYRQTAPHEVHNSMVIAPKEPDTELKYIALLEKTLEEKESDLKVLRAAVSKITDTDKRVYKLEITVDALQDKWKEYEPMILGLREFVTDEIASLKKISREAATASLSTKVEVHRKQA